MNISDKKVISKLWNSSKIQDTLRKQQINLINSLSEITELFTQKNADMSNYNELALISVKEWKMMINCKKDSLIQIEKKDQHYYLLKLTEDNLNVLQKNIRKGFKEDHTVKNASQSAAVIIYKKINEL